MPIRTPVQWDTAVALANELHLDSSLWPAIANGNTDAPDPIRQGVHRVHVGNSARNLAFRYGLFDAVGLLNGAGIEPLLFKGSQWLAEGTFKDVGERWMADLDIAVPPESLTEARRALENGGFAMADPDYVPGDPYPYLRDDMPGLIELHVDLYTRRRTAAVPIEVAWAESHRLETGSGVAHCLSPTHQVVQCIAHPAIQDRNDGMRVVSMRQLWTLARLVQRYGEAVDWAYVVDGCADRGWPEVVRRHLWLTERAFGGAGRTRTLDLRGAGHGARALASFASQRIADFQYRVYYTVGRAGLEERYGRDRVRLSAARLRELGQVMRRQLRRVFQHP